MELILELILRYNERLKYLPKNPYYQHFWMEAAEIKEKIKELEKIINVDK